MKAGRKIRVPRDCEKTDTDLNETRTLSKQKGLALGRALMKNLLKPLSSVESNRAKWNRTFSPKHRLVCFHSRWEGTTEGHSATAGGDGTTLLF